jgi:hypothetical protein
MAELVFPTPRVAISSADGAATASDTHYRYEVVEDIGPAWDVMAGSFTDGCLEQMAAYAVPRWDAGRVCGVLLHEAGSTDPVAMALAMVATIPMFELGLAYVKFGPLWRRHDRPHNPAVLAAALQVVKQVFAVERGLVARIMPPPDPDYADEWSSHLSAAGFTFHDHAPDPARYLVDLSLTEAEQLASLGAKWRANLNKALAHPLEIREADLKESLPDFLALYRTMLARKNFVDRHNIEVLPRFAAAAADAPSLGVRLFLASHEGRPVAGSIIVGAGNRVFVAFSASDECALSLRAGYALRWWIINRLRGSKARWLDLGGTEGDAGLRSFKLGNVGKRGRVLQIAGDYDFAENALSQLVSSAMSSVHKLMRTGAAQHLFGLHRA